jgi:hypothetical protein
MKKFLNVDIPVTGDIHVMHYNVLISTSLFDSLV